jgi:hypothetical protein
MASSTGAESPSSAPRQGAGCCRGPASPRPGNRPAGGLVCPAHPYPKNPTQPHRPPRAYVSRPCPLRSDVVGIGPFVLSAALPPTVQWGKLHVANGRGYPAAGAASRALIGREPLTRVRAWRLLGGRAGGQQGMKNASDHMPYRRKEIASYTGAGGSHVAIFAKENRARQAHVGRRTGYKCCHSRLGDAVALPMRMQIGPDV